VTEDKKVIINDVEYLESELSDDAKICINHVQSLDQKISSARFNLTQLEVGRGAFMSALKTHLDKEAE